MPFVEILKEWLSAHSLLIYLGVTALLTALVIFTAGAYATVTGGTLLHIFISALLSVIPAVTIAVHLVNFIVTRLVPPRILPKMDFSAGVPEQYRTMVVIPALLTSLEEVDSLAKQLEQHYLRNSDGNLFFAILADYTDADTKHTPDDDALRERAEEKIHALNIRYAEDGCKPFYFFLRARQWNASEEKWKASRI
jgi:cyclic beta-1,2-glucan synthetase